MTKEQEKNMLEQVKQRMEKLSAAEEDTESSDDEIDRVLHNPTVRITINVKKK